jgi:hypothetical protein
MVSGMDSMTQYLSQLATLEAHIRRRVRVRLVRNMKRRRTIAANFRKHGISRETAHRTAYSHRNWWALSHTWAIERMFPNQWFEEHGLFIKSTEGLPHWFETRRLINIP